jgi:hypothetical protein
MRLLPTIAVLTAALVAPAFAQTYETPEALLEAFYAPYLADEIPEDQEQFFSAALDGLFKADAKNTPAGEIGAIDFDPFINGQDFNISELEIGEPEIEDGTATVDVSFNNFDQPNVLTYDLVLEDGGWRIDDVAGENGDFTYRLTEIFEEARANW